MRPCGCLREHGLWTFLLLFEFVDSSRLVVTISGPPQRFLTVVECPHPHDSVFADCIHVSKIHFLPLTAVFRSEPRMNKYHDPVTRREKLHGLAAAFRPPGARLRQILFHRVSAV